MPTAPFQQPNHRFSRGWILAAAVCMQLCLGATYAWSAFVDPLRAATGLGVGATQLPFTIFYIVFPATLIFAGGIVDRIGPRRAAVLGGLLFGSGWLVAGLGRFHFAWTVVGCGLLSGVGTALGYIVPIAVGVRWFPERKGLVTGVAVAGFGGGSALVALIAEYSMRQGTISIFGLIAAFGAAFVLLAVGAGSLMVFPASSADEKRSAVAPPDILRDPFFRLLYLAMFAGLAAGFTIIANLKQLSSNALAGAAWAVPLFAFGNAAGRIVWGWIFDRARSPMTLRANLVLQGVAIAAAPVLVRSGAGLLALAALAGFNYGGVLVLYASTVAQRWGAERVARIYGRLFSANIPAALAPLLAGWWFDRGGSYAMPLVLLAAMLFAVALIRIK